jgi:hypothetical protein
LIPIAIYYLVSLLILPIYIIRYLIFASLAYYIFIAKGLENIKRGPLKIGVLVTIILLSIPTLNLYYTQELKTPWKKIIGYLNKNTHDKDTIFVFPAKQKILFGYYANGPKFYYYYANDARTTIDGIEVNWVWGDKLIGIEDTSIFEKIIKNTTLFKEKQNFWLVFTPWFEGDKNKILDYFNNFYSIKKHRIFDRADIYCY